MKQLSLADVKKVSGGLDPLDMLLCLTAFNLGLAYYNYSQINKTNALLNAMIDDIDFVYNWTIYQEAQLSLIPHYDEVRFLNLNQAYDMIPY